MLISICQLFYKIFLQRETFYRLSRLVLVICLGLSFILPLISIPQAWTLRSVPAPAEAAGYKQIPFNEPFSIRALGVTPVFIKSFEDIGYKNLSIDELTSLKSLSVTHEYIKSFETAAPGFIKGFKDMGYNVSLEEATSLKATGVTPAYVKEMKAKGFNSKDLNKYIQMKSAFN